MRSRNTVTTPQRPHRTQSLSIELLESRQMLDANNLAFVSQAYVSLLHRQADPGGLTAFSGLLDGGAATRRQVALGIQGSPEFQSNEVQVLYGTFLGRQADTSGLTTYAGLLAMGSTSEQVAAILAGSNEYFQTRGGGTNNGFLSALYQDALQRMIDPSGQAAFTQVLNTGTSRIQVALTILRSQEYQQDLVQGFYQQFLHRSADPGGLTAYVSALQGGAPDAQVVAAILASAEYTPLAQAGDPPAPDPSESLSATDVKSILDAASSASASNDAIIAVVDRGGRILGVRVESGVAANIQNDPAMLTFAVDGALAEARTGAFFGNDQAPLTSRTIQFISQSTITQREVESNPNIADPNSSLRGPGFVAPIGLGGHFPPGVSFTPQVDLFNIEGTNRDSIVHPDASGIKTAADLVTNVMPNRFNVPDQFVPADKKAGLQAPESYGFVSGILPTAQARGIGTLPGGIPIYNKDAAGNFHEVGGIGVFFPGTTGFADEENSSLSVNFNPAKRDRSLEAEYMAFAAVGGRLPTNLGTPIRLDLVGITLDTIGPGGTRGIDTLTHFGATLGTRNPAGDKDLPVDQHGDIYVSGIPVPDGWLVTPHDGTGLTAADVVQIVNQGIAQSNITRAAIRVGPGGAPGGATARMVFAVSDLNGNLLGLYRMPDATIFSIDVAVAKSRNTSYYADPNQLQPTDQLAGVPAGTAFSNRTFRYLAEPRFPEGIDGAPPGPFSILNDGGVDPATGLNSGAPLPASAFQSVLGYDAFHPGTNFHDPINLLNQNGIVFFPGAVPLYKGAQVGGFGVSGDGVDQDDVVTFAGKQGFQPPPTILTADEVMVRGIRLPYQKFDRNPEG
ncbi:MAG TPA: DUF4214 domain-containing protein [Gemmataceae bacterium]|nr:DUF4214 domain-containing protein [Gemmataceae bacterium]